MRGRGRRRGGRLRSLCEEACDGWKREILEASLKREEMMELPLEDIATHVAGWRTSIPGEGHVYCSRKTMLPVIRQHHHAANSHVSRSGARAAYTRSDVSSGTHGLSPVST